MEEYGKNKGGQAALDVGRGWGLGAGAPDPGEAGLVEPLGAVLTQLSAGGGAASINIDAVTAQLEELTRRYPFQARRSPPASSHHLYFLVDVDSCVA